MFFPEMFLHRQWPLKCLLLAVTSLLSSLFLQPQTNKDVKELQSKRLLPLQIKYYGCGSSIDYLWCTRPSGWMHAICRDDRRLRLKLIVTPSFEQLRVELWPPLVVKDLLPILPKNTLPLPKYWKTMYWNLLLLQEIKKQRKVCFYSKKKGGVIDSMEEQL